MPDILDNTLHTPNVFGSALVTDNVYGSMLFGSASAYDVDALAYFTAVEAASGSFDLTVIDPTYTEEYVKTAHSNFYAGLKTDGLWDKLTEFYFLAGKTFDGIAVKGKAVGDLGTDTLTNNNFTGTNDYDPAGSSAGLAGDGSTKYLDTGLAQASVYDSSAGCYITVQGLGSLIGATNTTGTNQSTVLTASAGVNWLADWPQGSGGRMTTPLTDGHIIVSGRSGTDRELYGNGATLTTDTDDVSGLTASTNNYHILAIESANWGSSTLTFAHIGTGLTDTEAANLSARVNKFMFDLGANTYYDAGTLSALDSDVASYVSDVFTAGGDFE